MKVTANYNRTRHVTHNVDSVPYKMQYITFMYVCTPSTSFTCYSQIQQFNCSRFPGNFKYVFTKLNFCETAPYALSPLLKKMASGFL